MKDKLLEGRQSEGQKKSDEDEDDEEKKELKIELEETKKKFNNVNKMF